MGPFPFALLFHIVRGLLATWLVTRVIPWLLRRGLALLDTPNVAPPSRGALPPPLAGSVHPNSGPDPHTAGSCPDCGGRLRRRLVRLGEWEADCDECGRNWPSDMFPSLAPSTPAPAAAPARGSGARSSTPTVPSGRRSP